MLAQRKARQLTGAGFSVAVHFARDETGFGQPLLETLRENICTVPMF